jgi:GNAT superfamily N-acetyltransferase
MNAHEFTQRAPTADDAEAVVALIRAAQAGLGDEPDMTLIELKRDWLTFNLAEEAILIEDASGQAVAFADSAHHTLAQFTVYGFVPPHPQQDELWRRIVAWGDEWLTARLDQAPAGERITVQHFQRINNGPALAALEAAGYQNVRTHYVMTARLTEAPPLPEWPQGIGLRPYVRGQDDDAIFTAGEESFRDMWNRPNSTKERWLQRTQAEDFDPSLWFWAAEEATGEPVAVCLCSVLNGEGEVEQVGVRRPWRRRGVALALLRHALGQFWQRSIPIAHLSVDAASPTGAPQVYHRAGFAVNRAYARHERAIRGAVIGEQ